jgi:hypothetical protein
MASLVLQELLTNKKLNFQRGFPLLVAATKITTFTPLIIKIYIYIYIHITTGEGILTFLNIFRTESTL